MSSSLNMVQLIWNLTADPEIRTTPNGNSVASFSIATEQVWKDAAGETQKKADFHNCIAWNKLAEILEKFTSKWKKLYVQGRLQTRTWDNEAWEKKYKTEIVVENLTLLTPKGYWWSKEEEEPDEWAAEEKKVKKPIKVDESLSIDDIPF